MKRFLAALLCALFAVPLPLLADDPTQFPNALVDQNCQDLYSVPKYSWGSTVEVAGTGSVPNGKCDNDNRVLATTTTPITADTDLGPIAFGTSTAVYIHTVGTTVTGGATTWNVCLYAAPVPHEPTTQRAIHCTATLTGAGDTVHCFGEACNGASQVSTLQNSPLPKKGRLRLDLIGATSFTGAISVIETTSGTISATTIP